MITGIYTIENTVNGKIYVGYAVDMDRRWRRHKAELRHDKHHTTHLQRAWKEYGEEMFRFSILVECEEQYLRSEEHYWCNLLQVHNPEYGYNERRTTPEKDGGFSEETRKKMGETRRGRPCQEHVKLANREYKHTEEARRKISEAGRKRIHSPETNAKRKETFKATVTERKRIGIENGTVLTDEQKRIKKKEYMYKRSQSDEYKAYRREYKRKRKEEKISSYENTNN